MPEALIVPLHFEGCRSISTESRDEIEHAFTSAGLGNRLLWPRPAEAITLAST